MIRNPNDEIKINYHCRNNLISKASILNISEMYRTTYITIVRSQLIQALQIN